VIDRRKFLKYGIAAAAGMGLAGGAAGRVLGAFETEQEARRHAKRGLRWAFLLDANRCVGCGFCVRACKLENEIPYEASGTRTWVERYVVKWDGTVLADSPKGARDGFTDNRILLGPYGHPAHGEPETIQVPKEDIAKSFFVPKLCNQCEKPACVQVCPVGATYQTADGVVLVDRTWCIGCGYCIMACPYGVRFFHPKYKVAEKCNWCYHRITKGMDTACVQACPFGARKIGNIMDPDDPVTRVIKTERVNVLKPEYGTDPRAYYIGLDDVVR
jgi:Fe-S-cluster-containing dehydrogenase component